MNATVSSSTALLMLLVLAMASCSKDYERPVTSAPTSAYIDTTFSHYRLNLTSVSGDGENKILVGEVIDASWSYGFGILYLGADGSEEPLGTLTLSLDTIGVANNGEIFWTANSATLSTSDVQSGQVWTLNARSYALDAGAVQIGFATDNLLTGILSLNMHRIQTNPDTVPPPEVIRLVGDFVARNN